MSEPTNWENEAKGILKAEMKRRNITYAQLSEKLLEIDVVESERNLRNKVSRGKFTAAFLMQCLKSMGVKTLHLED